MVSSHAIRRDLDLHKQLSTEIGYHMRTQRSLGQAAMRKRLQQRAETGEDPGLPGPGVTDRDIERATAALIKIMADHVNSTYER